MASSTTPNKTMRMEPRKRMHTEDAEDFTLLAALLDENHTWSEICDYAATVYGWNLTFDAGFDFSVAIGAGVIEGCLAKTVAAKTVTLSTNSGGGSSRIDLVEVRPRTAPSDALPQDITETASDAQTEVTLGAVTRTVVAAYAVGTGDGATYDFDLSHAGVDGRTLKVQALGTAVGGWNLSPGTGGAGVDQIIFGTPPGVGITLTADYTWQSGGTESGSSINTRKTRDVDFHVVTGTPGAGAPSWTSGSIKVCQIEVPAGWTGGSGSVTITNSVKEFMIHQDQSVDVESPNVTPNAGRIYTPIRRMDQVVHGCRLYYNSSTEIGVTPGWGSIGGVAWRITAETVYDVTADVAANTGWFYVYGVISPTNTTIPGSVPAIEVTQDSPDWLRRSSANSVGRFYLGAIYIVSTGPVVIRPFYTNGDRVFWQAPTGLALTVDNSTYDYDVSAWCPETGRMLEVLAEAAFTSGAAGDYLLMEISSHLAASTFPYPRLYARTESTYTNPITTAAYCNGKVRAEDSGGSRYINYTVSIGGSPDSTGADLYIQGYQDDYRTMDNTGAVLFY